MSRHRPAPPRRLAPAVRQRALPVNQPALPVRLRALPVRRGAPPSPQTPLDRLFARLREEARAAAVDPGLAARVEQALDPRPLRRAPRPERARLAVAASLAALLFGAALTSSGGATGGGARRGAGVLPAPVRAPESPARRLHPARAAPPTSEAFPRPSRDPDAPGADRRTGASPDPGEPQGQAGTARPDPQAGRTD